MFLGFSGNSQGSRGGVPSPSLRLPRLSLASSLRRPLYRRYLAAPGRLPTAKLHLCRLLRGSSGGLECQRQFCRGPSGNPPHTKAPRPSELSARTASATLCPEAALQTPGPKAPAAPHSPPKNLTDTTSSSMRKMCCAFLVLGISLASRRKEIWWEGTDS